MYIQVKGNDKTVVMLNVLQLLIKYRIDLIHSECTVDNIIYLKLAKLDNAHINKLLDDIRLLDGVNDVCTLICTPNEIQKETINLLRHLIKDAAIQVNDKGNLTWANDAALALLKLKKGNYQNHAISAFLPGYSLPLERNQYQLHDQIYGLQSTITIHQQQYNLLIRPLLSDQQTENTIKGALILMTLPLNKVKDATSLCLQEKNAFDTISAVSPMMQQLVNKMHKCALLDVPLLIIGETGSGKDIIAKACHSYSKRCTQPFLAINCAALPDEVVESELFGHAAGAYPNVIHEKKGFFEQANGGSVLLDEISEMSARMQTKLLRFLNDGRFRRVGEDQEIFVDVRIICSTQRDLLELVDKGTFRADLYYRLNVLTLTVPALRQRQLDIMPLTQCFIEEYARQLAIPVPAISSELIQVLLQYRWPGNVRQLRNVIYRAMTQLEGELLEAKHIVLSNYNNELEFDGSLMEGTLDEINKRFERNVLMHFYQSYPSTRKLAKRLGVSHTAIANKLREYGLTSPKDK